MKHIDIHPSSTAIRTTVLGIGVSILLIGIKGVSGYLGHSFALIADAVESGADILSSGLLWLGLRIAIKQPDEEHPYGHGKAEPIAAIAVSRGMTVLTRNVSDFRRVPGLKVEDWTLP